MEDCVKEGDMKKEKKIKKEGEETTQAGVEEVIVEKKKKVEPTECAPDTAEEEPAMGVFNTECGRPVYDMQVYNKFIFVCSGDSVRAYSLLSKECKKVFEGHTEAVKCLLVSALPNMQTARLYTGSYDKTVRRYSIKLQKCLKQTSLPHRVLCLHIAWNILYVGVDDGSVFSFNMKTLKQLDVFKCHSVQGGVTCMSTDQEGPQPILVTGSYDATISVCDAKSGLVLRTLQAERAVLCLKVVSDLVFSGSNGGTVHAHNIHNGELINIYKDMELEDACHAITTIAIFGKFMVTASLDGLIGLHELQSHAVLEVYNSPRVMVSSMAVHKGMVYIGCYDGSVRAVALLDLS